MSALRLYAIREIGGRKFRHNWSLIAWGSEYCCGVVGDTQERTTKAGKTQAGLQRAEEWHSTPVGEKKEKGRTPHEGQPAMGW